MKEIRVSVHNSFSTQSGSFSILMQFKYLKKSRENFKTGKVRERKVFGFMTRTCSSHLVRSERRCHLTDVPRSDFNNYNIDDITAAWSTNINWAEFDLIWFFLYSQRLWVKKEKRVGGWGACALWPLLWRTGRKLSDGNFTHRRFVFTDV